MMRDFNEADKKKKQARIKIPENPAGLTEEVHARLTDKVKSSLRDGNLPCGIAFKIARDAGVPNIAVGEIADRLGIRVTNCQIGCFKVDKIVNPDNLDKKVDEDILVKLETLKKNDALTCVNVFELARQINLPPMAVADVANARNLKVHHCQLGCF
jgi:hypothetical protein